MHSYKKKIAFTRVSFKREVEKLSLKKVVTTEFTFVLKA